MVDTTNRIQTILTAEDRTKAAFRGLQGNLRTVSTELKSFAASLGVLGGVGIGATLGILVTNVARTANELNRLNKQTGIAVEDLSRLQFVAGQTDTEFSALTTGIARLSKSMFEAASGNRGLAELFTGLGVAVKDAEGNLRAPLDVLADLADSISRVEDPAARLAVAQKLLGLGAAELIPFLEGGSRQIKELADQSDRLGATISTETVKAVDDFSDNLGALKASLTGLVATNIGPFTRDLADISGAVIKANASFAGTNSLSQSVKKVGGIFATLTNPLKAIAAEIRVLGDEARESSDKIRESFGRANLRAALKLSDIINEDTGQIVSAFKRQAEAFKSANDELAKTVERRNQLAQSFKDLIADINKPGATLATGTVLEPIRTIDTARDALQNKQDAEEAIRLAEQAREQLAALAKEGTVSKSFLTSLAKQAADIADRAALIQQDKVVDKIEETKARLKALADVAQIKIDLNAVDVQAQLESLQQQLQQSANERPIVIPAVLGRALSAPADQIPALMGKADGGLLTGPGGPRSDSLLGLFSPGEYVMSAAAVSRMGLPFMDAVNRMRVPRFADGGPVASASGGASTQFNVFLPGQAPVTLFSNDDVIGLFKGVIGRQAVKSGRRLR